MKIAIYDTNLTDAQWAYLQPMLPKPAQRGRSPKERRRIIDAILWVAGGYTGETFARWVVERTFGWLMHQRRLVRDYETTEASATAWIYLAMIQIQIPTDN